MATPLRTYAKSLDYRQHDLAAVLGVSQGYLSSLSAGKKRPSLARAVRIERATDGAVPVASWIDAPKKTGNSQ